MNPSEVTNILRQFNEWQRGHNTVLRPSSNELGEAIDAAVDMIERLEAAEKDVALKEQVIDALGSELNAVASSQDEWRTLAKDLLREIERQTCAHEETHRGGFLWEICDSCGAKWADDEGGKPEFKWPKVVERAHAMLAAAPSVPEVTDAMAIAFHAALTDGGIGQQEVEEIKTGLRAALAAITEAKPCQ